jgi:hypothetical protein
LRLFNVNRALGRGAGFATAFVAAFGFTAVFLARCVFAGAAVFTAFRAAGLETAFRVAGLAGFGRRDLPAFAGLDGFVGFDFLTAFFTFLGFAMFVVVL